MTSVLFTGYAPVHYLCFRPIALALAADPAFGVFVSGGLRRRGADGEVTGYDTPALYRPFGRDPVRVLAVDEIARRGFDVVVAANTSLIAPARAGRTVQIFHGLSFRNKAVRPAAIGFDHYFLVGPYMRRRFAETGVMAEDDPRALSIGFPKTDPLVDGSLDRAAIRERLGLEARGRPLLLYAPTGQRGNSLDTWGAEALRRLEVTGRFDVLLKLHDHPKQSAVDWSERLSELTAERTRVAADLDVIPMLCAADLLLTDASSVANEFALLDRPVLFLDVPELIERALAAEGSAVDLETWGRRGGAVVERPEEVVDAVDDALAHPDRHGEIRRAMAKDLFYNPGRATAAAVAAIAAMAGGSSEGPEPG